MGERGATAIEYGLIAALIAVSAIASFEGVGARIIAIMTSIADALDIGGGVGGGPPAP
jgi:Flp pilus assembly pilin Flp